MGKIKSKLKSVTGDKKVLEKIEKFKRNLLFSFVSSGLMFTILEPIVRIYGSDIELSKNIILTIVTAIGVALFIVAKLFLVFASINSICVLYYVIKRLLNKEIEVE